MLEMNAKTVISDSSEMLDVISAWPFAIVVGFLVAI